MKTRRYEAPRATDYAKIDATPVNQAPDAGASGNHLAWSKENVRKARDVVAILFD